MHLFQSNLSSFLPGKLKDLNKPCYWFIDAASQYTNRKKFISLSTVFVWLLKDTSLQCHMAKLHEKQ
jgi:hypothetical protein